MDNPRFLLPIEPWAVLFQESVLFRYDFNKDSALLRFMKW